MDPTNYKAQMAGKWNACAFEVLAATNAEQCLVEKQVSPLATIVKFANAFANPKGEAISSMLSHGEARGSKTEGTIVNLDTIRESLGLTNFNKDYDQTQL